MCIQQICEHLERAYIEVQYAAAEISYRLSSCATASNAAVGEAMSTERLKVSRHPHAVLAASRGGRRANERAKLPDPTFPDKRRALKT